MNNKQLKTKSYVDNPPIKDTITQTTFQMRFSKSNFMFIGKWIIAFVLIIVLGSQALNGFISSKFTKDSTTETIVHEYKKQIGTELVGGNFNFLTSFDDMSLLIGKKIYPKTFQVGDYLPKALCDYRTNGYYTYFCKYIYFNLFDSNNNNLGYNFDYFSQITKYGNVFYDTRYAVTYDFYNYNITAVSESYNYDYLVITSINYSNSSDNVSDINIMKLFLNTFYVIDNYIEVPIYETTTYTYEVRDNNYNWDLKLKQLSAFKPLFKFNQSFINEEYLKYNNLISYEYIDTLAGRKLLVERYKNDERLKPLFDNNNLIIGGKTESGLFKDKTKYYSFLKFNGNLDFDNGDISSAYNYLLDNYVTDFNIDSYLEESKYKVELKDLLEIFKFPIQIVNNLVYDFGVLIGFITWW